jgi:3-oxoacyl-[acyl-carrier protein] reductase
VRMQGKVVVVTGAGSGFGAGIAERLVEEGASVVVNDVDRAGGERVAGALVARFGADRAVYHHADVASRDAVQAMIEASVSRYGRVDAMINNAGVSNPNMPSERIGAEAFERIFNVNVKAVWIATCELLPVFRRQGGGCIINVASTGALRPRPGLALYNASKAAVVNMTKSMAVEYAAEGIRINALCPVAGDTPLLPTFMGSDSPEIRRKFIGSIPLGRLAQPRDIANAALFLASDEAAFITGVALEVDGGRCV